jgi:hypothetical protein
MQSTPTIDPAGPPVPEVVVSPGPRNPPSTMLGKLLSVIRGDKYMADAYPPQWQSAAPAPTADEGGSFG